MRTVSLVAALVVLLATCASAQCRHWRFGVTYSVPTNSDSRDLLGDAWGALGEYSFSDALTDGDAIPGDVSFFVHYRRFSNTSGAGKQELNYSALGLKWRYGPGANPGCPGIYGGAGLAAAVLDISPAFDGSGDHQGTCKLEWSIYGGVNFAKHLFIEVGYAQIPKINNIALSTGYGALGLRF